MTGTPHTLLRCLTMAALAASVVAMPLRAQDGGAPLSAIGWLDQALAAPVPDPVMPSPLPQDGAQDGPAVDFEPIASAPLDGAGLAATGLFTAERIGLPRNFWGEATLDQITEAIAALPQDTLPSANRLMLRVLIAEFAAPWGMSTADQARLLLARVDALIRLGALEQAGQLIDAAPEQTAALAARAFDIALLLGEEDRACDQMSGRITLDQGQAARIFCMARGGDWPAAHSALQIARNLGSLDADKAAVLERFLEEEEGENLLPPPQRTTPLTWRIMEALGDPVTTATLPVAYAHADLRGTSGWRAQLDAAERLTRAGVMQPNRLLGLYTQRRPAASGGMWERVRAIQSLDQAIAARDNARLGTVLDQAWALFASAELEQALAEMTADTLASLQLDGNGTDVLWKLLLLARDHAERATELAPDSPTARFVMALAAGDPLPSGSGNGMAEAIALGFDPQEDLPAALRADIDAGAPGLVLLEALRQIADASMGDLQAATRGLHRLRAIGLEETARQIGVELMLLERRG